MSKVLVGDFETTVYEGQEFTEVWASAVVELFTEDVQILHSIDDTFDYLTSLKENVTIYYHNLSFDCSFWLDYLLTKKRFTQAVMNEDTEPEFYLTKYMPNNSFKYLISEIGEWYTITIKTNGQVIEIKDSLKLLPFSVKRMGDSFKTKHRKLDMTYVGKRYAGCEITEQEQEYIKNDVLVVKECLEIMYQQGHSKLTIGACCLSEYKSTLLMGSLDYKMFFPNLYEIPLDNEEYGCDNAGEYVRKSYRGGWCYVAKGKERKIHENGITLDVNSLYPSMMSSESGNYFPVGKPTFWKGNYIPDEVNIGHKYFFIRISTKFKIKKNKLPFVQIKNTFLRNGREMLETSDFYNHKRNEYLNKYILDDGTVIDSRCTITMTMTDYKLFLEHYDVTEFEILDGCYFQAEIGLFDEYINKWKKIKQESTGAIRELAKLFLNNLYGKMATYIDSSFKLAYIKENGVVGFKTVKEYNKKAGYIPIGSAITSYARNFTIRAAQKNYYGKDKKGFIYADTDSIHCDIPLEQVKGVKIDPKEFCCWKCESEWDKGWFVRAKTYIENIVVEDGKEIKPWLNIKCAGMSAKCKELLRMSIQQDTNEDGNTEGAQKMEREGISTKDLAFIETKREIQDFDIGLCIHGKLVPKRIKGGIVLEETTFELR